MRSQFVFSGALLLAPAIASLYGESNLNHTCLFSKPLLSCSPGAIPSEVDTCCVETFGGLLLQTQIWSSYTGFESEGQVLPKNSWTVHGLWPDFCNGSYTQYCDLNRQYDPNPSPNTTNALPNGTVVPPYKGPGISTFVEAFGKFDLLAWMNKYWVSSGSPNQDFWGHEFSKHATCYSTFDVPCYGPQYKEHEEVVDFFETTIKFFQKYPTFQWLAQDGIRPTNVTAYSLSDIQGTLAKRSGGIPYVSCTGPRYNTTDAGKGSLDNGATVLGEIWYYSHVKGRPQDSHSVPTDATGSTSNCAKAPNAVHYYQRAKGSEK
ncbi:ribonuclease T2 family protein [Lophium mytilinum]|uniref:ribonuclease T2 n=1 Tax=Lophium mytilinum TaxID=390894 RepID=A0A6A6R1A0_9PEZI|nr:ribonuclease T2 family protein [Lophium mytilinum]